MYKKHMILFFILIFSHCLNAMNIDDDIEGILKKSLKTNKINHVGYGKYLVDSDGFSNIFPPCILSIDNKTPPLWSVAQVLDKTQVDAIGTAVAIKETTEKKILFMTAKHVVIDEIVTFRFGTQIQNILALPDSQYTDLICEETKCFVHPFLDFALVEAKINCNKRNINFPISNYDQTHDFNEDYSYTIYHYPWGVEGQRLNSGKIKKNVVYDGITCFAHMIDTLPGSSGAPIFYSDTVVGIHIGRGKHFSKTKIGIDYQDIEDFNSIFDNNTKYNNLVEFNRFIPLSAVKFNELTEITR